MHDSEIETLIHCTEIWRFRSAQHRYVAASTVHHAETFPVKRHIHGGGGGGVGGFWENVLNWDNDPLTIPPGPTHGSFGGYLLPVSSSPPSLPETTCPSQPVNISTELLLIKKKTKFSSYIRKSKRERLQSRIWLTASSYTVIRFVWVSAKFSTCTIIGVNGTLFEDKMRRFQGECAHFSFNKCPIYTHDGASAKFSTNSHQTDSSVCD